MFTYLVSEKGSNLFQRDVSRLGEELQCVRTKSRGSRILTYEVEHNYEDDVHEDEDQEIAPGYRFNRNRRDLDKHDDDRWNSCQLALETMHDELTDHSTLQTPAQGR